MNNRYRRLRKSEAVRSLVRETVLLPNNLVQPFFVIEGNKKKESIVSMPGIARYSTDILLKEVESYIKAGGNSGIFFGVSSKKDLKGMHACSRNGIVAQAVKVIKKHFPEFVVITDVCLWAYLQHGHCGILSGHEIDNDRTLPVLGQMALAHAQSGADFVAPSDMMDHRVAHIREVLDRNKFFNTGIISYAVKYASAFYGPFREAARSVPGFGDRKTYQMDPANRREALKEAKADIAEGADIVMVKPALAYLDVIADLRNATDVPVAAYHVSGEYAMIKAAAQKKWIDERNVAMETLSSIKRAGADIIFTYYAKDALKWL
jgi:porphobilinogen synthase